MSTSHLYQRIKLPICAKFHASITFCTIIVIISPTILENDKIKSAEIKDILRQEYFRRVKKILRSKLNTRNIIQAINSRAVSLIRYGAGIIDWRKDELKDTDRKTRKSFTMHRSMHPQSDVDRLYWKRTEGGRGLQSVEEVVELEKAEIVS